MPRLPNPGLQEAGGRRRRRTPAVRTRTPRARLTPPTPAPAEAGVRNQCSGGGRRVLRDSGRRVRAARWLRGAGAEG